MFASDLLSKLRVAVSRSLVVQAFEETLDPLELELLLLEEDLLLLADLLADLLLLGDLVLGLGSLLFVGLTTFTWTSKGGGCFSPYEK